MGTTQPIVETAPRPPRLYPRATTLFRFSEQAQIPTIEPATYIMMIRRTCEIWRIGRQSPPRAMTPEKSTKAMQKTMGAANTIHLHVFLRRSPLPLSVSCASSEWTTMRPIAKVTMYIPTCGWTVSCVCDNGASPGRGSN